LNLPLRKLFGHCSFSHWKFALSATDLLCAILFLRLFGHFGLILSLVP